MGIFQTGDLLDLSSSAVFTTKYDVVLDKGTYDAISLSPDGALQKRLAYVENVHKLIPIGGYLWITSCNWTSSEIISHFTANSKFSLREEIPVKQFKFGGQVGQTVCCLVFQAA